MANTASNVSVGKPAVAGAVWRAPITATAPKDASTSLGDDFTCLGYVSDDGLTNSNARETATIQAWGRDTVATTLDNYEDIFKLKLIEVENLDVLKTVYGEGNVTGTIAAGVTIESKAADPTHYIWVFEKVLTGNVLSRTVVKDGVVSSLGDITYNDSDAVGFDIEITALADSDGVTHYEYIKKSA